MQVRQTQAQIEQIGASDRHEVTNAGLQIQSSLRRIEAATAASELARQQLDAEQSKFEVGASTNFFVVQAQRDLADAQRAELQAILDYQKARIEFDRSQQTSLAQGGIIVVSGGGKLGHETSAHRLAAHWLRQRRVYTYLRDPDLVPEVSTVTVSMGDVVDTVGATGALEAVTTVQVGSQVSGKIQELYADFNSIVRSGESSPGWTRRCSSQIQQAQANLIRAGGRRRTPDRVSRGRPDEADACGGAFGSEPDSGDRARSAQVEVRSAQAQLRSSQASMTQAEASLNQAQVNLQHTVITAPIDGIVISRSVDVGQTVRRACRRRSCFCSRPT